MNISHLYNITAQQRIVYPNSQSKRAAYPQRPSECVCVCARPNSIRPISFHQNIVHIHNIIPALRKTIMLTLLVTIPPPQSATTFTTLSKIVPSAPHSSVSKCFCSRICGTSKRYDHMYI